MNLPAASGLGMAAVVAGARIASADPAIVLDKCTAFDRTTLHAAIERELVTSKVVHDIRIVVACPDAVTAHISIEPEMGLARTLDLGEVPGDLRVKLLAIAAVELARVADPAKLQGPASERRGDVEQLGTAGKPPPSQTVNSNATSEEVTRAPGTVDTVESVNSVDSVDSVDVLDGPLPPRPGSFAIAPRLGVRFFTASGKPMPHLAVDVEIDWLAVGLAVTRGTAVEDPLGTLTPTLVTAGASARLFCWGEIQLACLRTRLEVGVANVSAKSYTPMVTASDARAFYGQAGVGLDVEHSFGSVGLVAALEAAWAEGLVATAQDREAVRLAGFTITTMIGARWRP